MSTLKIKNPFVISLWGLAIPIVLQNFLSAAVGTADVLMMGWVSQDALAAVSLANQVQALLGLFYLGLTIGTGTLVAQYRGKRDLAAARRITFLAGHISLGISSFFAVAAIFVPTLVLRAFTPVQALVDLGAQYLRLVGFSYLLTAVSQIYLVLLKSMKLVKKSTLIASTTLVLNVGFNAIFIFGLFGAPKLGIVGVALGTVLARGLECVFCLVDAVVHKRLVKPRGEAPPSGSLYAQFMNVALPITLQGFVFGGAMAIFSAIMGRLGSDVVAANALASVVQHIATVASFGLAEAGAILLGHQLGNNELIAAKKNAHTLVKTAVLSGAVCAVLMLLCRPLVLRLTDLTVQAQGYFEFMYVMLSINVIFAALTYTLLCGVFCAGGDTGFGLACDAITLWPFCMLLGILCAFVFRFPPLAVFFVLNIDELAKTPFVLKRYFSYKWLKNITVSTQLEGGKENEQL